MSLKILRVGITEDEWKRLQPFIYYGQISHILRVAIKEYIEKREEEGAKNESTASKRRGSK